MCVSVQTLLSIKPLLECVMAQTPNRQCVISLSVLVCHRAWESGCGSIIDDI